MGKQAKKKEKTEAQAAKQRRHNRATRGINTTKRGVVWARRSFKSKDKDGKEIIDEYEVIIPPRTYWDPWDKNKNDKGRAQEPFDALHLDWREEMVHYIADANAIKEKTEEKMRIGKIDLGDGEYLYRVYKGDNIDKPKEVLFEIQSRRKLILERHSQRRIRRKKVQKVG